MFVLSYNDNLFCQVLKFKMIPLDVMIELQWPKNKSLYDMVYLVFVF